MSVPLAIVIRPCTAGDLRPLEWDGLFTPHRLIIEDAFRRQALGTNLMLVAEIPNGVPVGQAWIDLEKRRAASAGLLWAVRVREGWQRLGIGACLVEAAERALSSRGLRFAELGVEKQNPGARRFYERQGYAAVDTLVEEFSFTTPEGELRRAVVDQWVMRKDVTGV